MFYKIELTLVLFISSAILILAQNYGNWIIIDSLHEGRQNHDGIQLDNGNILITGGYTMTESEGTRTTEIFDINTMKWTQSIPMNKGRAHHDLIRLKDGSILAIGGYKETSCEILSNDYKNWVLTDSIKTQKYTLKGAVLMQDGNVLITGGYLSNPDKSKDTVQRNCEIFDFKKGKWNFTAALNIGRFAHTTTLLQDGRILVTGGGTIRNDSSIILNTCEIFDPQTNTWSYTTPMHYPRMEHSAIPLSNGRVLVIGGRQSITEIYDPAKDFWEDVGEVFLSTGHNRAIVLGDEEYLLLIHDYDSFIAKIGWEIFSLKTFESLYYEKFNRIIWEQVVLKIDENRVIVAGGTEAILYDTPILFPSYFCQVFDFSLTNVEQKNNSTELLNDILLNCYPNPFNAVTNISLELNNPGWISIDIFNLLGEKVYTIYEGFLNKGNHNYKYDANFSPTGIYFIKVNYENKMGVFKIIHLK